MFGQGMPVVTVEEVMANYMGFTGMSHDCKTSDSYHRQPHDQGQKRVGKRYGEEGREKYLGDFHIRTVDGQPTDETETSVSS